MPLIILRISGIIRSNHWNLSRSQTNRQAYCGEPKCKIECSWFPCRRSCHDHQYSNQSWKKPCKLPTATWNLHSSVESWNRRICFEGTSNFWWRIEGKVLRTWNNDVSWIESAHSRSFPLQGRRQIPWSLWSQQELAWQQRYIPQRCKDLLGLGQWGRSTPCYINAERLKY